MTCKLFYCIDLHICVAIGPCHIDSLIRLWGDSWQAFYLPEAGFPGPGWVG